MRYRLRFSMEYPYLDMDYHSCLMSFLKRSLEISDEASYEQLFGQGVPTYKPYTFAVWLPRALFGGGRITLPTSAFDLHFSTCDPAIAIHMVNGFLSMRNKAFPLPRGNSIQLRSLEVIREPSIRTNSIRCSFMSPLLVRDHSPNGQDRYLTHMDEDFLVYLRKTVRYQIENVPGLDPSMADSLELSPRSARTTVVRYYGQCIDGNIGSYMMKGEPELLTHLYQAGIGSRRGSGFGMFGLAAKEVG